MTASFSEEEKKHLISSEFIRLPKPSPDSHKGENGKITLVVGGSPLFHGAGQLSAMAANRIINRFASTTNDMVYLCTTPETASYYKQNQPTFLAITREGLDEYISQSDVILIGTGMMRSSEKDREDTKNEPEITKKMTLKVLSSRKKAVLDGGSIQVIQPQDLLLNTNVIITPNHKEMANLFNLSIQDLLISHSSDLEQIKKLAEIVQRKARECEITILLKGPIDIIANKDNWLFSRGGVPGMTKGGTGDVLAGIVAALYSKEENSLMAAAAASFITKRAGEDLFKKYKNNFDAIDLEEQISTTFDSLRKSLLEVS